jgi:uncharacterized protein YecT (DUF1311 family)
LVTYEFRRAAVRIPEEDLIAKFSNWLSAGVVAKKLSIDEVEFSTSMRSAIYIRTNVEYTSNWNADGGTFDNASYQRDMNMYEHQYRSYERSGRSGLSPRMPYKPDYYSWQSRSGNSSGHFRCFAIADPYESSSMFSSIEKTMHSFEKFAWEEWINAHVIHEETNNCELYNRIISEKSAKIAENHSENDLNRLMKSSFDKHRNSSVRVDVRFDRIDVLEIPFWVIDFQYKGKPFWFAVDSVDGKHQGGSGPLDKKRLAWMGAAGCALLLPGAAYINWHKESYPEKISVEHPVSSEYSSSSARNSVENRQMLVNGSSNAIEPDVAMGIEPGEGSEIIPNDGSNAVAPVQGEQEQFYAADLELNRLWNRILNKVSVEQKAQLLDTQRKWLKARDQHCSTSIYTGRSLPLDSLDPHCARVATSERIAILRQFDI